jgi:3-methyladenine DNA glycosylase AlkD
MPARAAKKPGTKQTAAARTTSSKTAAKTPSKAPPKAAKARLSLAEVMRTLEKAGSAQTRKTYLRHGAQEPMFGVSFAALKDLVKKIGVDHELAKELWATGNHDARTLAIKIADPARATAGDLDRWRADFGMGMCGNYVAMLAAEGPHAAAKVREWLAASEPATRATGWKLLGHLSNLDERASDELFTKSLAQIEKSIHSAPNAEREAMNSALIMLGGRSAALRKSATAAARRIGKVEIDHGDTECKTPDAVSYIEKMWAQSAAKKFASPAAQERAREPMRTRC